MGGACQIGGRGEPTPPKGYFFKRPSDAYRILDRAWRAATASALVIPPSVGRFGCQPGVSFLVPGQVAMVPSIGETSSTNATRLYAVAMQNAVSCLVYVLFILFVSLNKYFHFP